MSAVANEVLIQQLFAAYGQGDTATLYRLLASDVEYRLPGRSPMAGTYRGREEVLALWDRQRAYLGGRSYRVRTEGSVSDGDRVVLLACGVADGPSGALRWEAANAYRISDGEVSSCRVFVDDLYAFDAFWAGMPVRSGQLSGAVALAHRWVRALADRDLEAAVACFDDAYVDVAPARLGESVHGQDGVRRNLERLFADVRELSAEVVGTVVDGDNVWMEWRMHGIRADGTGMEFVGVNIFEVEDGRFRSGRIYTELVREAGGIDAQLKRMTGG